MGLFGVPDVDIDQVIRGVALLAASQTWTGLTVTMQTQEETVLHSARVYERYIREGYVGKEQV